MPVTVRLSQLFHERLGPEIADELAHWFNTVDAASKSDLRDLQDLLVARFDARMEQRLAEHRTEIQAHLHAFERRVEHRLDDFERRLTEVERRLTEVERRLTEIERRLTEFERRFSEFERRFSDLGSGLHQRMVEQTRWMFGVLMALVLSNVALWFR